MKRNVEMMEVQVDGTQKKERIQSTVSMPNLMLLQSKSYKAHRNGIKKVKFDRSLRLKNIDPKFRRNLKFSQVGNRKAAAAKTA